jgi:RimJ/RimL family protein N-acetyltransferase
MVRQHPLEQVSGRTESVEADSPNADVISRVRRGLARKGAFGVLVEALTRARRVITYEHRLLLFSVPEKGVLRVQPRLEPGTVFETEVIDPEQGLQLAAPPPALRAVMQEQIEQVNEGDELIVGRVDGRLAAWAIVGCGSQTLWPLTETGSELPLGPRDAVFTAGFVVPEFRGRRMFQAMYGAAANRVAERGADTLWSWCEVWNEASRRAMLGVGFIYRGTHARRTTLGVRGPLRVELEGGAS